MEKAYPRTRVIDPVALSRFAPGSNRIAFKIGLGIQQHSVRDSWDPFCGMGSWNFRFRSRDLRENGCGA